MKYISLTMLLVANAAVAAPSTPVVYDDTGAYLGRVNGHFTGCRGGVTSPMGYLYEVECEGSIAIEADPVYYTDNTCSEQARAYIVALTGFAFRTPDPKTGALILVRVEPRARRHPVGTAVYGYNTSTRACVFAGVVATTDRLPLLPISNATPENTGIPKAVFTPPFHLLFSSDWRRQTSFDAGFESAEEQPEED